MSRLHLAIGRQLIESTKDGKNRKDNIVDSLTGSQHGGVGVDVFDAGKAGSEGHKSIFLSSAAQSSNTSPKDKAEKASREIMFAASVSLAVSTARSLSRGDTAADRKDAPIQEILRSLFGVLSPSLNKVPMLPRAEMKRAMNSHDSETDLDASESGRGGSSSGRSKRQEIEIVNGAMPLEDIQFEHVIQAWDSSRSSSASLRWLNESRSAEIYNLNDRVPAPVVCVGVSGARSRAACLWHSQTPIWHPPRRQAVIATRCSPSALRWTVSQ